MVKSRTSIMRAGPSRGGCYHFPRRASTAGGQGGILADRRTGGAQAMPCTGTPRFLSRREMLRQVGGGLGSLALADLLRADEPGGTALHHAPTAKRVLMLFMAAGVSQVDSF